jgi:hypothetical protein
MSRRITLRCAWCKKRFTVDIKGRPPKYCRRAHRQRMYEAIRRDPMRYAKMLAARDLAAARKGRRAQLRLVKTKPLAP